MATIVGVDVGSYAVKMAVINHGFNKAELQSLAVTYNPIGQSLPSDETNRGKLALAIKQMVAENKLSGKQVYAALPESLTYTSVISMPFLSDAELASSIHWEAEQHIPVPLDEVNLEYDVLYKPTKGDVGEKMRILLVAAKKEIIDQVVELYHLAGLEVVGLETSMLAAQRSLSSVTAGVETALVCQMGALSTDILMMHQGEVVLTYTIPTGGLALTRALEKNLGLPAQQAEEYKRSYGLDPTQLEGKVRAALAPSVNLIVAEMRKAMQYYQTSHVMNTINAVVLTGGGAYLPGLPTFLAEAFAFEVTVANPLTGLTIRPNLTVPQNPAAFATALGLALRKE